MICFDRKTWLTCVGALWLHTALAAPVAVTLASKPGSSAENTVLIFDPLNATPPAGHDNAIIDQINKRFVPRINVVRTGTLVTFPNSDQIHHEVYSFSPAKVFQLKLYARTPSAPVTFDKPGLVVLGCNIHDKMLAFVGVVDTPYFAKADAAGKAVFNLPAGRYRLRVWNPGLAAPVPSQEVAVDQTPLAIALNIDIDAAPSAVAAWPE
jgi:plastocyanin